ncbi:unnamed protein product [Rotaria sordida]|uniref:Uncharacterized protein n=1 Tax=Rotaria sordida TaxID=392033 RepID=A0A814XJ80_9BILA|nr:unnamed protein product [Rotaria sordida]CAF1494056.1 unnamed protein product [Rotaria sordida]
MFPELPVSGLPLNSTPREAFVTFCNNQPKYLSLLIVILDAVHHFSTRPIIAYGIDVDLNIDNKKYPRLIKRRLSQKDCGPSIYFCKIYAIVHSQIDYGIYIEADTLVNWNVDILFDVLHRWPYPLPLSPRHFIGANFDETGINVLLWQAKANHTLCKIDPYYSFLSAYESNQTICSKYCHTAYIFIHGCKDANEMHKLFKRLKNHTGSPFIQTPHHGMHYLNETQYTCCYPDSHPSSIHPLLCEHRRQ